MFSGHVSRGRCLGVVEDCDRIAVAQGAETIAFDYPPNKADRFHDRIYRDTRGAGDVTEVWCRAEALQIIKDTASVSNLPLATELFGDRKRRPEPPEPVESDIHPRELLRLL